MACQVVDQELRVEGSVFSLDGDFMRPTEVLDGLGPFCEHFDYGGRHPGFGFAGKMPQAGIAGSNPFPDSAEESFEDATDSSDGWTVHDAEMISMAVVQRLAMPTPHRTKVGQIRLILTPGLRSSAVALGPVAVRAFESFRDRPAEVRDGNRLLLAALPVFAYPKISRFVHRRKSIDLAVLKDAERMSFLQEAAALKHLQAESVELLGVFRSVPIEMISRLRFVSTRNEIVYSLVAMPERTVTRVHDIAAVRDTASREIHLVPHRTRSRAVMLVPGRDRVK